MNRLLDIITEPDNTVLTEEHDATEEDMVDARIRAKAEGFAGEDMQLHTYIAA